MKTVEEILDYAIDLEQQAADFYAEVAENAETAGMKKVLLDFSKEEKRHKQILLSVKADEHKLTPEKKVLDLKISDYLVEIPLHNKLSYQDALIIAMKREQAAYELYSNMAAELPEGHLKTVINGLAVEEAKHKLFFESEYDDRVMSDN